MPPRPFRFTQEHKLPDFLRHCRRFCTRNRFSLHPNSGFVRSLFLWDFQTKLALLVSASAQLFSFCSACLLLHSLPVTRAIHRYTYVFKYTALRALALCEVAARSNSLRLFFSRDYETLHIVAAYCHVFVHVVEVSWKSLCAVLAARGGVKSRFSWPISVSQRGRFDQINRPICWSAAC